MKRLRTRQPEGARATIAIVRHLDVWQQVWRVLDLVDQYRRLVPLQKKRRIVARELQRKRVVQGHIGALPRRQVAQEGRLAHLPSAGDDERAQLAARAKRSSVRGTYAIGSVKFAVTLRITRE